MGSGVFKILGIQILSLAVGCTPGGPMKVQTYWGTTAKPFEKGATFDLRSSNGTDRNPGTQDIEEIIRTNNVGRLVEMGYPQHAGSGPPSFWVTYRLGQRTQPGLGVASEEVGDLVIEVTAPTDGRLVWRGSAEARIDYSLAPEVRKARIERAVQQILKQFAPR